MPTDMKGSAEEEPERRPVRRSTRVSAAQSTSEAVASPVRPRKSTASSAAAPRKSTASSTTKSESQEDGKRPARRSRRASSAEPTSAADASPPKPRKSVASKTSESSSSSTRRASIMLHRINEGLDSEEDQRPSTPSNPKHTDDTVSVGTPRRKGRASSVPPTAASPARLTRRTAAALAALEASAKPAVEVNTNSAAEVKSESASPSSRIPVPSSKIPTPTQQSPSTRSSSVTGKVESPSPECVRAAEEASRVTTPTSAIQGRRSRTGTSSPGDSAAQSPSTRTPSMGKVTTPTQQSPVAGIASPSGQPSTPSRKGSFRSLSSTPTHSPDTRASVKSHKKCCTPPVQSPEIRPSSRSSFRSTGSNRSTPSHSPATRASLPTDSTPCKRDQEAKKVAVAEGDAKSTVSSEAIPVSDGCEADCDKTSSPSRNSRVKKVEQKEHDCIDEEAEPVKHKEQSFVERAEPDPQKEPIDAEKAEEAPLKGPSDVKNAQAAPKKEQTDAEKADPVPQKELSDVKKADPVPQKEPSDVKKADPVPQKEPSDVKKADPVPQKEPSDVKKADPVPQKELSDVEAKTVHENESSRLPDEEAEAAPQNPVLPSPKASTPVEDVKYVPDSSKTSPPQRTESADAGEVSNGELSTIFEDGSETTLEITKTEDNEEDVALADDIDSIPKTETEACKTPEGEDPESNAVKECAPLHASQSGSHETSADLRFDVAENDSARILPAEKGATPHDHGAVLVKLSPPKLKKSPSVSPGGQDGRKISPRRKLCEDFTLAVDEADLLRRTPQKVSPTPAKVSRMTPKTPSTPSELTTCVSPMTEGKLPVLSMPSADEQVFNSMKSPRARDGSPTMRSEAPESPELSPINRSVKKYPQSLKTNIPEKINESNESDIASDRDQSLPDVSSPKAAPRHETLSDGSGLNITVTSPSQNAHLPTTTDAAQVELSLDACSPAHHKTDDKLDVSPAKTTSSHSDTNKTYERRDPRSTDDKLPVSPEAPLVEDVDSATLVEPVARIEADPYTAQPTPKSPTKGSSAESDLSPVKPAAEDESEADHPCISGDIIACDEESVDSGNASEDEEKRKIRAVKKLSPIEENQPSNKSTPEQNEDVEPSQAPSEQPEVTPVKSVEVQSNDAMAGSPLVAESKTISPTDDEPRSPGEPARHDDAKGVQSEPPSLTEKAEAGDEYSRPESTGDDEEDDAAESADSPIKKSSLNATRYSSLPIESSGDEVEDDDDGTDENESDDADEDGSGSDEELLDVSNFSRDRSRRVSFLEQSCIVISDEESSDRDKSRPVEGDPTGEKMENVDTVGKVNKFLVTNWSPARTCTPGKVKHLVAKLNRGEETSADGMVVASSSAVGFEARDAPPSPAVKPPVGYGSTTASEFLVEPELGKTTRATGELDKDNTERSIKRKADNKILPKSPPTKVFRANVDPEVDSGPKNVVMSNIPKKTPLVQLRAALRQAGIDVGLNSLKYVQVEGKPTKTAMASYDSMKNALNAVSKSAKLKLNGQRIYFLMEEGQIKTVDTVQTPAASQKPSSPKKKFCGIVSNLPVGSTISDVIAAYEKLGVKYVSQVKIFRLKSHRDAVFAKIKFFKKSALLKAIVVSEHVKIGGRKIQMKIMEQV